MGSDVYGLPSRDSARIAKSELLTLQIYELFPKLASFLAKKIKTAILSGGCFKMGSVDIVLPSRDSARIAKSELLTLQR